MVKMAITVPEQKPYHNDFQPSDDSIVNGFGMTDRQWWFAVLTITTFSLVLRIVAMMILSVPGHYPGDELGWLSQGEVLSQGTYTIPKDNWIPIQGGKPGDSTAFRTPLFPLFIAAHIMIFGMNVIPLKISLILISSLTGTLIAMLGRETIGRRCGILAATMWAIWPPALFGGYRSDTIMSESIGIFLELTASLALAYSLREGQTKKKWLCVAGTACGLAILTRPYFIVLSGFMFLFVAITNRERKELINSVAFIGCLMTVISPWVLRNYIVMGAPVLSTQSEHIYMGNNQWARGSMDGSVWQLRTEAPQMKALESRYPDIWQTSEVERYRIWSTVGKETVISNLKNPARFIWLESRKFILFFSPLQSWSVGIYRYHYLYTLILPFVLIGFLRKSTRPTFANSAILIMPITSLIIICLAAYYSDRFRYPCEPYFLILSAHGILCVGFNKNCSSDSVLSENTSRA